jgi:multidrug efflux pump subunit AcrA (membrane-fusion protein)
MDLVRKAKPGEEVKVTGDLTNLLKSTNETVIASVKTIKGEYKYMPSTVSAQGIVTYDTRNIYTISSRVNGRLEKIYLKYAFQQVSKGQKIAEIYSPELLTAERELLFLVENDSGNKTMIDAATNKLELLGLNKIEVNILIEKKEIKTTFSIHSQYSGYVVTNSTAPWTSGSMSTASVNTAKNLGDGIGSAANSETSSSVTNQSIDNSQLLREGDYVSAGQTLFTIVNANSLRIELDLPSSQAASVKKDFSLKMKYENGLTQNANVDFVQPFFSEGQEFVKVRVYSGKVDNLHIGQLVNAEITLPAAESLWVPKVAVLDLGNEKIVFVKDRGVLKPKKVSTGLISGDQIEIRSGLASSDEIAANAQYLIDSESFIKTSN